MTYDLVSYIMGERIIMFCGLTRDEAEMLAERYADENPVIERGVRTWEPTMLPRYR